MRRLPALKRDVLMARIGDEASRQVQVAGMLSWLPAEVHAHLFDVTHAVLTSKGAVSFWRDLMFNNLELAVLRPLVEGAISLFGRTPHSLVRMSPRAWSLVARDCGGQRVQRGSGRTELTLEVFDLPRVLATPGYVDHCVGNFEAVLKYLKRRGTVNVLEAAPDRGKYTFELADVELLQ
jgi:hypothetical protein